MQIEFYPIDTIKDDELTFAVICAIYLGKWIYVRHKERNTWEIPGGHREQGESIVATAERELFEETGATKYSLTPICDYSGDNLVNKQFGRLFLAKVSELGPLPHSEIGELSLFDTLPENLTHAEIQPYLLDKTVEFLKMGEFIVD